MWDRRASHGHNEALFGGRGVGRVWNVGHEAVVPPFTAALACELDPGGQVGEHVQEHDEELVIGVSGEGHATVDGAKRSLAPGCVVGLALGQILAIVNDSDAKPLRYLIIKASQRATENS